jgi:transglutaminase-like putative cysteine protease
MTDTPGPAQLQATWFLDGDDPRVADFARRAAGSGSARERAIRLYYAVRDEILYDPYGLSMEPYEFKASACLARRRGFCVTKSALMAAAARAVGIPARLGYADVKNHLTTERLRQRMGNDLFVFHGYAELFLDGKWVKATPVFNIELCEKFRVLPLEFDGETDSIFHPFDADGRRHMEYVAIRGTYDDLPFEEIRRVFYEVYPRMYADTRLDGADFAADAARETAARAKGSD